MTKGQKPLDGWCSDYHCPGDCGMHGFGYQHSAINCQHCGKGGRRLHTADCKLVTELLALVRDPVSNTPRGRHVIHIVDTECWITVASFSDDQWAEAQKKLAALRKSKGNRFKLLDH